jgi:hypothetical protein
MPMRTETDVQNAVRLAVQSHGGAVWRNNVGALLDERGVPVRFGLANDSAQLNRVFKSSDLIGLCPRGRFLAIECKEPGWRWRGGAHEGAQLAFIEHVRAHSGLAGFASCVEHAIDIMRGGSGAPL